MTPTRWLGQPPFLSCLCGSKYNGAQRENFLGFETLHLYADAQFASPYVMSVFVALHETGLSFEIVTVDRAANENQVAGFACMSLACRVTILRQGDFSLSESSSITKYLDESFPGTPLYPVDPRSRARARQVQAWLRSDLMPITYLAGAIHRARVLRRQEAATFLGCTRVCAEALFGC